MIGVCYLVVSKVVYIGISLFEPGVLAPWSWPEMFVRVGLMILLAFPLFRFFCFFQFSPASAFFTIQAAACSSRQPVQAGRMKNIRPRRRKKESNGHSLVSDESVKMTKITPRDDAELDFLKKRALISTIVIITFFAVLVSRLWFLQIQQGETYSNQADNNRVRYVEVAPPRGNIFDSMGREIVTNRPSFNVVMSRENNRIDDALLKKVALYLELDVSILLKKIRKMAGTPGHIPIRLAEDIDWEKVALIENNRMELPGVRIEVVPLRVYHYGNFASHIISLPPGTMTNATFSPSCRQSLKYASRTALATGAAPELPCRPCSTRTVTAISGFSAGAKQVNQA